VHVSGASRGVFPDACNFHCLSTHWNLGKRKKEELNLLAICQPALERHETNIYLFASDRSDRPHRDDDKEEKVS
jgi:hypothetical protein